MSFNGIYKLHPNYKDTNEKPDYTPILLVISIVIFIFIGVIGVIVLSPKIETVQNSNVEDVNIKPLATWFYLFHMRR